MHRKLLVSDLDGTLLGNDEALRRFAGWYGAHRDRLGLVYASGRGVDSVMRVIKTTDLPEPVAVIGGVGTEICLYPSTTPLPVWTKQISAGWDGERIRRVLARLTGLEPQPAEFQSALKVSYYLHGARPDAIDELRRILRTAGLRAAVLYSSDRDLDVLPAGVDKGAAAAFLAERWGFAAEEIIVAGDSGNDLSLFEQGFEGIIVHNAQWELRRLRGATVYHADRAVAAGVLEGLQYWQHEVERDGAPALQEATA